MSGVLWPEPVVGAFVLAPAVLDGYRYLHPDTRWAKWGSRRAKILSVVLVTLVGQGLTFAPLVRALGLHANAADQARLQNRARAMQVLRARLLQQAQEEHDAAMSAERRSQVGGGGRGEKIRTYNFKENRLTDHRIGFTIYRLQEVLAGALDEVVDALAADERARQLATHE